MSTDSKQLKGDSGSTNNESNAHRETVTDSSKLQLLLFLSDHPLADTHAVHIPNFVGNSLLQFDQGKGEYYCSAMLTFFKPWRNGLDLKSSVDPWDEMFSSYHFSTRQLDLMKNMNIQYECLDA